MDAETGHDREYLTKVSPRAEYHRRFAWTGGVFDTARRAYTAVVEGTLCSPNYLVMATLRGGARRHAFVTDCGHRYDGPDRPGVVSFLPAGCARQLRLEGVAWEWASVALEPEVFARIDGEPGATRGSEALPTFSYREDSFLFALLRELERLYRIDGALDPAYCDAMSFAVAHYLSRSAGVPACRDATLPAKLPPWRLRRIGDYVDAHLEDRICIAALADLVGVSEGYLHRAFRATTGETPLQFVNRRRIERAVALLDREPVPIAELALKVGFSSPSHFARTFRKVIGTNPADYCRGR